MKLFLFAVFDSASGVYDRPWVSRSEGEAVRGFKDIASDADHPIGKHQEFYSLFRLRMFDGNKGMIDPEVPVVIAKAHELVAQGKEIPEGSLKNGLELVEERDSAT